LSTTNSNDAADGTGIRYCRRNRRALSVSLLCRVVEGRDLQELEDLSSPGAGTE